MPTPEVLLAVGPFQDWGEVLATLFLFAFVVFGLVGIGSAGRQFWRAALIARSDPIDAGSVYLADGEVELEGTAEAIDPFRSRYSNTECVAYTYKLEERERTRNADGEMETSYETVESGSSRRPFYVRDESGRVAVDPEGATLSFDSEKVSGGQRRKYESRLEPGETVHVYGQKQSVVEADDLVDGEDTVVGDGDEVSQFMISDTTEFRTALRYVASGIGRLLLFSLVTAFAGGFFLVVVVEGIFGVDISPIVDAVTPVLDGLQSLLS